MSPLARLLVERVRLCEPVPLLLTELQLWLVLPALKVNELTSLLPWLCLWLPLARLLALCRIPRCKPRVSVQAQRELKARETDPWRESPTPKFEKAVRGRVPPYLVRLSPGVGRGRGKPQALNPETLKA